MSWGTLGRVARMIFCFPKVFATDILGIVIGGAWYTMDGYADGFQIAANRYGLIPALYC